MALSIANGKLTAICDKTIALKSMQKDAPLTINFIRSKSATLNKFGRSYKLRRQSWTDGQAIISNPLQWKNQIAKIGRHKKLVTRYGNSLFKLKINWRLNNQ